MQPFEIFNSSDLCKVKPIMRFSHLYLVYRFPSTRNYGSSPCIALQGSGLAGLHPVPCSKGNPATVILFWDPGLSSLNGVTSCTSSFVLTKQTPQQWHEISCLFFLTLSGRRGKKSSFIALFVDFGFLWEVSIHTRFLCRSGELWAAL